MKHKLIIFFSVIAILLGLYSFDFVRAKYFIIEIYDVYPVPAVADGTSPIYISVRLTNKNGNPIEGHSLFALPRNGGIFRSARQLTDSNGECKFIYFPIKASGLYELDDAIISITNESNSIFIEVPTRR